MPGNSYEYEVTASSTIIASVANKERRGESEAENSRDECTFPNILIILQFSVPFGYLC